MVLTFKIQFLILNEMKTRMPKFDIEFKKEGFLNGEASNFFARLNKQNMFWRLSGGTLKLDRKL
jgi:hypothetical protein